MTRNSQKEFSDFDIVSTGAFIEINKVCLAVKFDSLF